MFTGEAIAYVNPELIWARSGALTGQTQASFPFDGGGTNEVCVTQKIVDAYEMADGRLRTAASDEYPYSETGFTEQQTSFSGYRLNANVYNMYANREMRFYASIGFSECFWPCLSSSESRYRNVTVNYDNGSLNGRSSAPNNYPITGYVIKKYINEVDAWIGTSRIVVSKSFPTIRYAEILLSYAEALNELEGYSFDIDGTPYARNNTEIGFALNQVRYRAGLPGLVEAELNDPSYVRSKIKKERMVEFLFENRRYYDVRRWGDYETSETQTIMGMNTSAIGDSYYQRVIPSHKRIASRIVNKKMIFLPIPSGEIKRLPKFDQNPGW